MNTKYQGYRNWDTWNLILTMQNDEGLASLFTNAAAIAIEAQWNEWREELVESPTNLTESMRHLLVYSIGDLDEIDWNEVSGAMKDK